MVVDEREGRDRMTADAAERREALARLVVRDDSRLHEQLRGLAARRLVFFAGLPGTGKSLLTHQLAHLALAAGRTVHLLQWDVTRPVFQASEAGRRYPERDGVTHSVIRKAVGLWARDAIVEWALRHPGPEHLLIGETPFVGHRFIELARQADDPAEPLLSAPSCRFVVPVPSRPVREFLVAERERRGARPLHAREREDAPPQVLRDLWRMLAEVAQALGVGAEAPPGATEPPYDPLTYRRVYERLLRHRHADVAPLDTILPTAALSVYDLAGAHRELAPAPEEAARVIQAVEARYPDLDALEREIARWWVV